MLSWLDLDLDSCFLYLWTQLHFIFVKRTSFLLLFFYAITSYNCIYKKTGL